MTLLEVAKHALEAMEDAMYRADTHEFYDAKESLRYAIEQAEQAEQEPVGQLQEEAYGRGQVLWFKKPADQSMLYTAPTPRKPLTDEEIERVCAPLGAAMLSFTEVARAIERAHGIGEQQ